MLINNLLTGCGSFAPIVEPLALLEARAQPEFAIDSPIDDRFEKQRGNADAIQLSRRMATATNGITLLADMVIVDPVTRPISTTSALASLTLKSVGG
ncbi:MAG: hypothetical protein DRQ59_14725, partial [Gammaproteobacteria bacterium]